MMLRCWLSTMLVAALLGAFGCGEKKRDATENGKREVDEDAAVPAEHWGPERVVYAADWRLEPGGPVPDGEQWPSPPTDEAYLKFTYRGPKLIRLEGIDVDGRPWRFSKLGVRQEWAYAAHGGLIEEATYDTDGQATLRMRFGYDKAGRCTTRFDYAAGRLCARASYVYQDDGRVRTQRLEMLDGQGAVVGTETTTEYWNAETDSWDAVEDAEDALR